MSPQKSKQIGNGEVSCLAEHLLRQVDSAAHTRLGGAGAPPSGKLRTRHSELRTAFTLIELLVVIAIISLLVSILLPSLQKAKKLTRRVTCMTQLRNIGTAFMLYGEENRQLFPDMPKAPGADIWSPPKGTQVFAYALAPYLGVSKAQMDTLSTEGKEPFICTDAAPYDLWGFTSVNPDLLMKSTYYCNPFLSQEANTLWGPNPRTLYITDSLKPGETTVMLCSVKAPPQYPEYAQPNHDDPGWLWLWLDCRVETSGDRNQWLWDGKSF